MNPYDVLEGSSSSDPKELLKKSEKKQPQDAAVEAVKEKAPAPRAPKQPAPAEETPIEGGFEMNPSTKKKVPTGHIPPKRGRAFDRHSGTGRGREIKKGGAGRGNWGKPEAYDEEGEEQPKRPAPRKEEIITPVEPKEGEQPAEEKKEEKPAEPKPEDNEKTLEEYAQIRSEKLNEYNSKFGGKKAAQIAVVSEISKQKTIKKEEVKKEDQMFDEMYKFEEEKKKQQPAVAPKQSEEKKPEKKALNEVFGEFRSESMGFEGRGRGRGRGRGGFRGRGRGGFRPRNDSEAPQQAQEESQPKEQEERPEGEGFRGRGRGRGGFRGRGRGGNFRGRGRGGFNNGNQRKEFTTNEKDFPAL